LTPDNSPLPPAGSQRNHIFLRWIKFNAVGGIGIGVQLAALAVFRSWLKMDYLLATGLAVEIAVIHNFLWHERFTWADRPAAHRMQSLFRFAKFNATNGAVSILGNLVLMRLLVGKLKFNYIASNCFAIVACSLLNFLLGDRIVFDVSPVETGLAASRAAPDRGSRRNS
jgi:putative flippase GtrA